MKKTPILTTLTGLTVLTGVVVGAILITQGACNTESRKRSLVATGNKYFSNGKYREATLVFSKAINLDPRFGEAYYRLGLSQIRLGQIAPAMRSLRRACELQPNNDDAFSKLGDLYLAVYLTNPVRNKQFLGDFGEIADSMLKRNTQSFEGLRLKGYHLMGQNKLKEAIESFEAANRVKPNQGNVVLVLAQALSSQGNFPEAEAMVKTFLGVEKTYGPAYDFLYFQYVSRKRLDEATAVLRQKVDNNPKNPDFLMQLASHYLLTKDEQRLNETIDRLTGNVKDFPKGHMLAGDYFFRLRLFDKALVHFTQGAKGDPKDRLAYQKKLVECLYAQDKKEEALKLVLDLQKDHSNDMEIKALRAAMRLQSGNLKEIQTAATELQAAVARIPDNPVLRHRLGEALLAKGELDQARLQLEEAVKQRPSYMAPRFALASIYLSKKNYTRAQTLVGEILSVAPGDINARLLRVSTLIGVGDIKTAREELDSLLNVKKDLREALYLLAVLDLNQRRFPEAESGFGKLQSLGDSRGVPGLAEALMSQNKAAQAQQAVQAALQKEPESTVLRMTLAKIAAATGQFELAIMELNQAMAKNPDSVDLLIMVGQTNLQAERPQEAEVAFLKAKQLAPTRPEPLMNLALTYEAMKDRVKARPIYEQILKMVPDHPIALNNLAYILAESGENLDQALKYAQLAKQKYPQNNDIADTLGWIYIRKNLSDNAVKIFSELVGKNPNHVTWRYHLAMAFYQKGDKPSARRELETALRNKPAPSKDEEGKIRDLLAKT